MRRKNMLALGLSFVLGVGSSTMPVLADISAKREEVKLEKEEVQEIPEESNGLLDSMFANTMEHTSENNLNSTKYKYNKQKTNTKHDSLTI